MHIYRRNNFIIHFKSVLLRAKIAKSASSAYIENEIADSEINMIWTLLIITILFPLKPKKTVFFILNSYLLMVSEYMLALIKD